MLALIVAAAIDVEQICAKYGDSYVPPPAAVAALAECGHNCEHIIAERYANGDGVTRDFDVATYFLCQAEEDMNPAEFEGMFAHLQQMRAGETTADLDFCDHVNSGYGSTYCAHLGHQRAMPELDRRLAELRDRAGATPQIDALVRRGNAYVTAEANRIGELSRGGTGYAAILLTAEVEQKERFVANVQRWSSERAPAVRHAEAKRADRELNAAYRVKQKEIRDMMETEEIADWVSGWDRLLRDAQRAWIAYRDAFAAFYVEQWHGAAPPAALRREIVTALTRDRTDDLQKSF